MAPFTTPEEVQDAHRTIHKTFKSGLTKSIAWRKWQLKQMWWMVCDNEKEIAAALHADLNRHDFETHFIEFGTVKTDILHHLNNVERWAADEIPDAGFLFGTLGRARIRKEPLGVALVLGAWNFPFAVVLKPLMAAISAGCCAMLKPSEISVASQDLMLEIIPKYLDSRAIRVVTGGPKETTLILEHRFDQIFYTGSGNVGKIIQKAAAKHLTPTVLELGGQGPAIVTPSANIDVSAKRILFSKFLNSGQICLATNHVYVDPSIHDEFVDRIGYHLKEFLKNGGKDGMSRIISDRNFERVASLLEGTQGKVVHGGEQDKATRYIHPTVVTDVTLQDSVMSQELFSPLLPIVKADYKKACELTQTLEHPLAVYIFSNDEKEIDEILSNTQSGGVTINDIMFHAGVPNAPFGGVGGSGTGAYQGKYGFDTFTHNRTIVRVPFWMEYFLGFRYPPYSDKSVAKVALNTKVGFKRGETMEDQKIGGGASDFLQSYIDFGPLEGNLIAAPSTGSPGSQKTQALPPANKVYGKQEMIAPEFRDPSTTLKE
ncbi:MAG: hypothetical protein Q9195_005958 [Heterodermia aff. obscurata]